jgi:hypothetical protein
MGGARDIMCDMVCLQVVMALCTHTDPTNNSRDYSHAFKPAEWVLEPFSGRSGTGPLGPPRLPAAAALPYRKPSYKGHMLTQTFNMCMHNSSEAYVMIAFAKIHTFKVNCYNSVIMLLTCVQTS